MRITGIETFAADAGWRSACYLKIVTDSGVIGWSEYGEHFGTAGVTGVIHALGELVVGAFDSARVLVPGVPADEDRYRLEFELQPEGSAPVHISASAVVGRAGDAHGERLTFDFGAEPVQIGFGRGGVLSVHFRPLDLADNGRYDLYAEVRLVSPPAELPEPDLVWQLGLGLVLLALVRHLRRRS